MTAILLIGFVVLLFINVPVSFALAIASLLAVLYGDIPPMLVAQRMTASSDSFILLAVPFFLLAGHLMAKSGMARDIIAFANATVGTARGGLAQANIAAGTLMGGMTGSAVAEASSTGGIMIPPMKEKGYDGSFCAGVTAAASTISVVIPPSVPMIIFCVVTGTSVSRMFIAGIIPGILMAVVMMVLAWAISVRRGYPRGPSTSLSRIVRTAKEGIWGLIMPFVIIGSIRFGVATPTEAAVIAVAYCLFVGMFIYKSLKIRDLPRIVLESCVTTGVVMLMIATASIYGLIVTREQIPQAAAHLILGMTSNPTLVMLLIFAIYVIIGMVLDLGASIIILVPVLLPVTQSLNIDPIHFGIVTTVGLAIGLATPPVGASLFVTCGIAKCNLVQGGAAILPFVLGLSTLVIAIILFPGIATWLPSYMN